MATLQAYQVFPDSLPNFSSLHIPSANIPIRRTSCRKVTFGTSFDDNSCLLQDKQSLTHNTQRLVRSYNQPSYLSSLSSIPTSAVPETPSTNKDVAYPVIECKHWLEIQDVSHRYGSYLRQYYDVWLSTCSQHPFFFWLDHGEGRHIDLSKGYRPRSKCKTREQLDRAVVHYCTEEEREQYRVVIQDRLLVWVNKTDEYKRGKLPLVDTGDGDERWIFVIDVAGNCFMNRKVKGRFHHSSFVAGAPVRAAGRIVVKDGIVVSIGPNSGHYRTTNEQLQRVIDDFFGNCINVLPLDFRSSFDVQSSSD